MNKKKFKVFLSTTLGFLVVAILAIYEQGAFENIRYGGVAILAVLFLIVMGLIYKYCLDKEIK